MEIIYAQTPFPEVVTKSIFLAGPSPRGEKGLSWRPEALKVLERLGYDGTVFIPETKEFNKDTYLDQIEWEHKALNYADIIIFWIPRDLEKLLGFTTNIEFGWWMRSGKVVLAAPEDAPKMGYLVECAKRFGVPLFKSFEEAVGEAMNMIGDGALRTHGETQVPLGVWRHPTFQSWFTAQKNVGNRLEGAYVEWSRVNNKDKSRLYGWALNVDVWVDSENRHKTNELVLGRPDISSVLLYRRGQTFLDTEIVLVREFRSPGRTKDSFIWELPGGSSKNPLKDPLTVAVEEVHEETGLLIDPQRLRFVASRQLMGTFSAHQAHLFSCELSEKEMDDFKKQVGVSHGDGGEGETGERTYVEISTPRTIIADDRIDWSNVGMIVSVLS